MLATFDLRALSEHTSSLGYHQRLFRFVYVCYVCRRRGLQVRHKHKKSIHLVTLISISHALLYFCPPLSVSYMLLFRAFTYYPSLPRTLLRPFQICLCFVLLSPFLEFSFIQCFISLAAIHSFPLPFSPLACLRLALPSFDFSHLFSHSHHPFSAPLPPSTLARQMNSEEEIALPVSAVISWSD